VNLQKESWVGICSNALRRIPWNQACEMALRSDFSYDLARHAIGVPTWHARAESKRVILFRNVMLRSAFLPFLVLFPSLACPIHTKDGG